MIVRTERGRLRIALQTDHAALAGEFAGAWGGGLFRAPEPLAPVRRAAELHDQGWSDWEREPMVIPDSGQPYDFLDLPPDAHTALYDRGIRIALAEHPYTGLLVSLHGTGLYKQRHGHMPELTFKVHDPIYRPAIEGYLSTHEAIQAELMADVRPDTTTMWTHYRWLQCWDLLSLFLCLGDPTEGKRRSLGVMPQRPGGPETALTVQGAGPGTYCVSPWPFAPDHLDVMMPVRYVADRRYADDQDFQAAFQAAPTEPLTLRLVGCMA